MSRQNQPDFSGVLRGIWQRLRYRSQPTEDLEVDVADWVQTQIQIANVMAAEYSAEFAALEYTSPDAMDLIVGAQRRALMSPAAIDGLVAAWVGDSAPHKSSLRAVGEAVGASLGQHLVQRNGFRWVENSHQSRPQVTHQSGVSLFPVERSQALLAQGIQHFVEAEIARYGATAAQ